MFALSFLLFLRYTFFSFIPFVVLVLIICSSSLFVSHSIFFSSLPSYCCYIRAYSCPTPLSRQISDPLVDIFNQSPPSAHTHPSLYVSMETHVTCPYNSSPSIIFNTSPGQQNLAVLSDPSRRLCMRNTTDYGVLL